MHADEAGAGEGDHRPDGAGVEEVGAQEVADDEVGLALAGRLQGGGQLGQRGSHRHHGEADEALGQADQARHLGGRRHQDLGGDEGAAEAEESPNPLPPGRELAVGQVLVHLLTQRVVAAPGVDDDEGEGGGEQPRHQQPGAGSQHPLEDEAEHHRHAQREQGLPAQHPDVDGDRGHQGGGAEDQREVGDVGADDVAGGQVDRALQAGEGGHQHLGGAGPEADHDGTDDHFGHPQRDGHPCRPDHELVGGIGEEGQASDDAEDGE